MGRRTRGWSELEHGPMIGGFASLFAGGGTGFEGVGGQMPSMSSGGFIIVPRCLIELQRIDEGFKLDCVAEEKVGGGIIQNLTTMLAGGPIGFRITKDGWITASCQFPANWAVSNVVADGAEITFSSSDPENRAVIHATCDYLQAWLIFGGVCFVLLNNTPICAGILASSEEDQGEPESALIDVCQARQAEAGHGEEECAGIDVPEVEGAEPEQMVTHIGARGYLRSVWAIASGAFLHPFSTTHIDLSTGDAVDV